MGLRRQQLEACLHKNWLQKRRNLRVTLCEVLSPLVLILLLSYGYFQSDILSFNAKIYAQLDFDIPNDFSAFLPGGKAYGGESLDDEEDAEAASESRGTDIVRLNKIRKFIEDLLKGPLPAPTFDQFVLLSTAVSSGVDADLYNELIGETSYGRSFGNLVTLGTMHLAPAGPVVDAFMEYATATSATFGANTNNGSSYFNHIVHANEEAALEWIDDNAAGDRAWVLVLLDTVEEGHVDYTLRFNYSTVPHTAYLVNWITLGLDDRYQRYFFSGFHSVSQLIDQFAFNFSASPNMVGSASASQCKPPSWTGVPFPTAGYDQNLFYLAVGYLLGLVLTMATLYPVSRLIKDLVQEKETKMRETAAAMGLSLGINALAWWITSATLFSTLAFVMALTAKLSFFPRSDFTVLLAYFGLLLLSEVALAFLVAACFSRARLAAIVGPVALFACCLPRYVFFGTDRNENVAGKKWASLSSVAAFCFGADVFADYEYAEVGVGWRNAFEGDYSLVDCLLFMAFDGIAYLLLAAYLETVAPAQHGSPRHPLFFVQPLWRAAERGVKWLFGGGLGCFHASALPPPPEGSATMVDDEYSEANDFGNDNSGVRKIESAISATQLDRQQHDVSFDVSVSGSGSGSSNRIARRSQNNNNKDEEPMPLIMGAPAVTITNLVKDYHSSSSSLSSRKEKKRPAVDGLSLELWAGQVTCLLGHNGAGKSTTVSMLTGLTPPTSGDVTVHGRSLRDDLSGVRGPNVGLGVCPQTNVVFESLTVEEHLVFFAKVKGVGANLNGSEGDALRKAAVASAVADVGLSEKRYYRAAALSGGQKRKLCLAMALIGDPKVVYLDEPTSGMDPYSRRATWELVRRAKQGRVVVLTTHFMDEAEVLGDRVAIMARGRLRCVGSALWLKARFGLGYRLVVTTTRAIGQAVEEFAGNFSAAKKQQQLRGAPVASAVVSAVNATAVPSSVLANIDAMAGADQSGYGIPSEEHKDAGEFSESDEMDEFGIFSPPRDEQLLAHSNSLFAGTPKHKKHNTKGQDSKEASSFFTSSSGEETAPVAAYAAGLSPAARAAAVVKSSSAHAGGVAVAVAGAGAGAAERAVRQTVQSAIPTARFAGAVAREVSFRLPRASAPQFPGLLEELDAMPDHVSAYSLAVTSLEEVFVQVAEEDEKDRAQNNGEHTGRGRTESGTAAIVSSHGNLGGTSSAGSKSNTAAVELVNYAPNNSVAETHGQAGSNKEEKHEEGGENDDEGGGEEDDDQFAETNDEERSQKELGFFEEIAIQFFKRWTVFKRDRKGAFFQLGVPILLIAGILSILTIRVTPAGPSLTGLPSSYGSKAKSEVTIIPNGKKQCEAIDLRLTTGLASQLDWLDGLVTPSTLLESYSNSNGLLEDDELLPFFPELGATSYNLSHYFLDTYNVNRKNRWGAFVCDDRIPTEVIVDWESVNALIPFIFRSLAASPAASQAAEEALVANAPYTVGPAEFPIASVQAACALVVDDQSNALFVPCLTVDLLAIDLEGGGSVSADQLAAALLNASNTANRGGDDGGGNTVGGFITGFLSTLNASSTAEEESALSAILSSSGLFPNGTLTLPTNSNGTTVVRVPRAEIDLSGASIADDGSGIAFTGINIAVNENITFAVGNLILTVEEVQELVYIIFGDEIETYNFITPSALSVAHNASSWHGLWLFQGLARQEQYRTQCLDPSKWGIKDSDDDDGSFVASDDVAEQYAGQESLKSGGKLTHKSPGRFVVRNHPLPLTTRQTLEVRAILSVFASLFVLIALSYAPAAFVTFVVKERQCKSLHLQKVSGANVYRYWIATYLWDGLLFLGLSILVMLILAIYGDAAAVFLQPFDAAVAMFLLVFLFGLSTIPFNYVLSFAFHDHATAQITLLVANFTCGFIFTMGYFICNSIESTQALAQSLRSNFFLFVPPYNLGEGLLNLSRAYYVNNVQGGNEPLFGWDIVGGPLTLMALEAIGYVMLTLLLETKATRALARQLDKLRVAPFLLRLSRQSTADAGVDADVLEESSYAKALHKALQASPHASASEPPSSDGNEAAAGSETGAGAVDAERTASAALRAPSDPYLLGADAADADAADVTASSSRATEVAAAEAAAEAAAARCGWDEATILLNDLHKVYPPPLFASGGASAKHAVKGISLAVPKGETFGFLGINGAGKTTTLSILTGDVSKSTGAALVEGNDVGDPGTMRRIGYCPQEDPLLELMTGAETLRYFGRLKGVGQESGNPTAALERAVARMLHRVGLSKFGDQPCGGYSGGMKRKLSFGVALMGNPKVLLLDEPSTGMDPVARRRLWRVIAAAARHRSVSLTTHSMEEAEALCTRVGIMVGGKFQCLGSIPRLKGRFGGHLTLELRCRADNTNAKNSSSTSSASSNAVSANGSGDTEIGSAIDCAGSTEVSQSATVTAAESVVAVVDRAVAFVEEAFPGSKVQERHGLFVRFEIPLAPHVQPQPCGEGGAGVEVQGGSGSSGGSGIGASLLSGKFVEDDQADADHKRADKTICESEDSRTNRSVPQATTLADTFRVIERAKDELRVDDYAVGHGSLEQVFIRFAKRQQEETAHVAGVVYADEETNEANSSTTAVAVAGGASTPSTSSINTSSSSDVSVPTGFYSRSSSSYSSSSPTSPSPSSAAETNPLLASARRTSSTRQPFLPARTEPAHVKSTTTTTTTKGPNFTGGSLDPTPGAAGHGSRASQAQVEML